MCRARAPSAEIVPRNPRAFPPLASPLHRGAGRRRRPQVGWYPEPRRLRAQPARRGWTRRARTDTGREGTCAWYAWQPSDRDLDRYRPHVRCRGKAESREQKAREQSAESRKERGASAVDVLSSLRPFLLSAFCSLLAAFWF